VRPSDLDYRIRSRPVQVSWAGWHSDTQTLQQNGWQLSAHQDICRRMMGLAIKHDMWGAQGMTCMPEEWEYERELHDAYGQVHPRQLGLRLGKEVRIHSHGPIDLNYRPIDAMPRFESGRITSLEDLAHFAPAPLAMTNPIIVQEDDVNALLSRILDKQQEAKTAHFREQIRKGWDGASSPIRHKFEAQILSIAA
jgi:hypothetical protein